MTLFDDREIESKTFDDFNSVYFFEIFRSETSKSGFRSFGRLIMA